jgi:hypothetical protein
MAKNTRLFLLVIDHETKVPLPEALAAIDNGAVKGKVRETAAALAARPARRLTTKGLKNGTYMVPTPEAAADLGFTEIKVKWSWNAKAKARVPYVSLDGEYTPASNPARRRAVTLVTEGIAVKVDGPVAEDDLAI